MKKETKQKTLSFTRSSRPEVFCKKAVLRNITKFAGKHLFQSLFFNKVASLSPETLLKKTLAQVFSCEFCKISKNNFFTEHVWATASKVYFILRVRGLPPTNQTLILLICLVSVLTLLLILFNSFQYLLQNNGKHQPFKRQHHKMIKHKQFVGSLPINCLSVLDHFVRFALKGLN